ncbi:MAG: sigma 54-interacting transcriptional regulator [Myxococcaceae bacterium]
MTKVLQRTDRLGRQKPSAGSTWMVSVATGPDAGRSWPLDKPATVGSGEECEVKLTDTSVSRRHVKLEPRPQGVSLEDLQSTNGTLVGGARVETALIPEHGVLTIGRTTLTVRAMSVETAPLGPQQFEGLVATSAAMRRVFGLVDRLSSSDTPVVFVGEPGTGRESLARALHSLSPRRQKRFVAVQCSHLAPQLIDEALFGTKDGSAPGALIDGDGGTVFLESIGELPPELQARLLRVLEKSQVKTPGGSRQVDVRIVASCSHELTGEARAGRFNHELAFKLAVATIRVPSLRERREDLPVLIGALVAQLGKESFSLTDELLALFAAWDWPGNVRELRNVVARAVVSESVSVDSTLNPPTEGASPAARAPAVADVPFKEAKESLVEGFTREYLKALVVKHDGNVSQMARASGLARTYVHELLTKHGLTYKT